MATVTKLQEYGNQLAVIFSDGSRLLAKPFSQELAKVPDNENGLKDIRNFGNLLLLNFASEKVFAYPTAGGLWLVAPNEEPTPPAPLFYWPFAPNTWNMNNGNPGDNFRTPERPNHNGMDMGYGVANQTGYPIKAAGAGIVEVSGPVSTWGNRVVIFHPGTDFKTTYNHMYQQPLPGVGQAVDAGTILGGIGTTGGSTGNHLHFEVFRISTNDYIDPLEFMAAFNPGNAVVP